MGNVRTPWGDAQHEVIYGPGVVFYETASHGGFKLDKDANRKIPVPLRRNDSWYEEDCEALKVMYTFPSLFPSLADKREQVVGHMKRWFPEQCQELGI